MGTTVATLTTNATAATNTTLAILTLHSLQEATKTTFQKISRFFSIHSSLEHFSPQSCSGCSTTPIRDRELVNKREKERTKEREKTSLSVCENASLRNPTAGDVDRKKN